MNRKHTNQTNLRLLLVLGNARQGEDSWAIRQSRGVTQQAEDRLASTCCLRYTGKLSITEDIIMAESQIIANVGIRRKVGGAQAPTRSRQPSRVVTLSLQALY